MIKRKSNKELCSIVKYIENMMEVIRKLNEENIEPRKSVRLLKLSKVERLVIDFLIFSSILSRRVVLLVDMKFLILSEIRSTYVGISVINCPI